MNLYIGHLCVEPAWTINLEIKYSGTETFICCVITYNCAQLLLPAICATWAKFRPSDTSLMSQCSNPGIHPNSHIKLQEGSYNIIQWMARCNIKGNISSTIFLQHHICLEFGRDQKDIHHSWRHNTVVHALKIRMQEGWKLTYWYETWEIGAGGIYRYLKQNIYLLLNLVNSLNSEIQNFQHVDACRTS